MEVVGGEVGPGEGEVKGAVGGEGNELLRGRGRGRGRVGGRGRGRGRGGERRYKDMLATIEKHRRSVRGGQEGSSLELQGRRPAGPTLTVQCTQKAMPLLVPSQ